MEYIAVNLRCYYDVINVVDVIKINVLKLMCDVPGVWSILSTIKRCGKLGRNWKW